MKCSICNGHANYHRIEDGKDIYFCWNCAMEINNMLVWKNIKDELPKKYSDCLIKVKEKPSDFEIKKGFYPADRVFECAHFATFYDDDYDGKHFELRDDGESRFDVYLDNEDIIEILWVYEDDVLSLISKGQ